MLSDIMTTQVGHLGVITLSRPKALNALTLPMVRALQRQLDDWSMNPLVHAVVIQSSGGKAFCAGGDVRWLYDAGKRGDPDQLRFFNEEYHLNKTIYHYPKPYVALMDGLTMGGGVGISLHGSHPVASSSFEFAMPETAIGFFPDIGASYLLNRTPGFIGIYLALTGNRLNAEDSLAAGLVRYVIPAHQFAMILHDLQSLNLTEHAFERVSECLQRFSSSVNPDAIMSIKAHVDDIFNDDNLTSILNRLKQETHEWAQATYLNLLNKSPLSLYVTFAQLKKAAHLDFDECIALDYQLVQHFIRDHDFYEGVRSLLIDKDKSPHWQPVDFQHVRQEQVTSYFT